MHWLPPKPPIGATIDEWADYRRQLERHRPWSIDLRNALDHANEVIEVKAALLRAAWRDLRQDGTATA